jgi:hypothetical protein
VGAIGRFVDHLPYYRREPINARSGVHTPRSTLAAWGGAKLEPLSEAHRRFMLSCRVLHADETPVPLLEPSLGKTKEAYVWAWACSHHDPQPGVICVSTRRTYLDEGRAFGGEREQLVSCAASDDGSSSSMRLASRLRRRSPAIIGTPPLHHIRIQVVHPRDRCGRSIRLPARLNDLSLEPRAVLATGRPLNHTSIASTSFIADTMPADSQAIKMTSPCAY